MDWLSDNNAVSEHISKYDLVDLLNSNDGFVKIENFFPTHVAESLSECLMQLEDSRWSIREDSDDYKKNTADHRFYVASELEDEKSKKSDMLSLAIAAVKMLLPEKRSVFSAARYKHNDAIAKHDDHALVMHKDPNEPNEVLCSRDVAVVYYLSPGWKESYGGLFVDHVTNIAHVPKFNTVVSFTIPRFHEVTPVTKRAKIPRLSLFGWFLVEGDIYSYEDVEKKKKKKDKKKKRRMN